MADYERTVEDDLDWSLLDQLHAVVLQIGTFCFRTKQVCLTVLVGVVGVIATFTSDKLDQSIFVAAAVITVSFWFLDSVGYYYQVKLRGIMDGVRDRIHKRHADSVLRGPNSEVISDTRTERPVGHRLFDTFFNHSMWLYLFLIVLDILLCACFAAGVIG
ncbi:MAG: hypothetical protein IH855_03025 [Bacteroidetes bacterium]|nr:hypothetical protein [Bacteroidota bacterium]